MNAEHDDITVRVRSRGDSPDFPDDPRLMDAVKEYLAEIEAGRIPDRQALLRRYPDLKEALAQCLDGLELVHKGASRAGAPPAPPRDEPADSLRSSPLGDFQILREIGRGGRGAVYRSEEHTFEL